MLKHDFNRSFDSPTITISSHDTRSTTQPIFSYATRAQVFDKDRLLEFVSMSPMRYNLALCVVLLAMGLGGLHAARLLQGVSKHPCGWWLCQYNMCVPTEPPSQSPIIFLRPVYYQRDANELPLTYNDRNSHAKMDISVYTPNNTLTNNLPFKPLGSLVRDICMQ